MFLAAASSRARPGTVNIGIWECPASPQID
jgi:hypothetical protein